MTGNETIHDLKWATCKLWGGAKNQTHEVLFNTATGERLGSVLWGAGPEGFSWIACTEDGVPIGYFSTLERAKQELIDHTKEEN